MKAASLTQSQSEILAFLRSQPSGGCRVNWLPTSIDFAAYRECREAGLLEETEGRGGFLVADITAAGRSALERSQ